jgi:hypothetical protein
MSIRIEDDVGDIKDDVSEIKDDIKSLNQRPRRRR